MWRNYHKGVTEKEAKNFWAIRPPKVPSERRQHGGIGSATILLAFASAVKASSYASGSLERISARLNMLPW